MFSLPKDIIQKIAIEYLDDVESFSQIHPYIRRCINIDNVHRKHEQFHYPNDRIRIFATKIGFEFYEFINGLHFKFKDSNNYTVYFYLSAINYGITMELLFENSITKKIFKYYPIKQGCGCFVLEEITRFLLFHFVYKLLENGCSCAYSKDSKEYFFN